MLRLCKYPPRQKLQRLLLNGGCVSKGATKSRFLLCLEDWKKTFTFE